MISHSTGTFGPRGRVAQFLLTLLSHAAQKRYLTATGTFDQWAKDRRFDLDRLDEESQDWVVADSCMDVHDDGAGV